MKSKTIVIVIAFVVVFGFTGYALGFFGHHETPMQMIATSLSSDQYSDKTISVNTEIKKKKTESDTTYSDLAKATVTVAQKVDAQDISNSSTKISFDGYALADDSGSPFSKMDMAGDFLMSGKVFYVRATKLPAVPFFDPALIKDKWWSIDIVAIAKEFGDADKAKEVQDYLDNYFKKNQADTKIMQDTFAQNNVIVNPHFTGRETISGHTVRDVSFTIDEKVLGSFVLALQQNLAKAHGQTLTADEIASEKDSINSMLDVTTISPIVVGVGADDHHLYKMSGTVEIKDPSYDATDPAAFQVVNIGFSGTVDYATPVVIEAPATSTSIEKLISQFFQ